VDPLAAAPFVYDETMTTIVGGGAAPVVFDSQTLTYITTLLASSPVMSVVPVGAVVFGSQVLSYASTLVPSSPVMSVVGDSRVPSTIRVIYFNSALHLSVDRCGEKLAPMDTAEVDDIPFDFTGIAATERITSFQVVVTWVAGNPDDTPSDLAEGPPSVGRIDPVDGLFYADPAGRIVLQRFRARVEGTVYGVRGIATLSSGRVAVAGATLPVSNLAQRACLC
jgi:hypothetical protein